MLMECVGLDGVCGSDEGGALRGVLADVSTPPALEESEESLRFKRIESLSGRRRRLGEVCLTFPDRMRPRGGTGNSQESWTSRFSWSSS